MKLLNVKKAGPFEPALYPAGPVCHQPGGSLAAGNRSGRFGQDALVFLHPAGGAGELVAQPAPVGPGRGALLRCCAAAGGVPEKQNAKKYRHNMEYGSARWRCIILSVKDTYMDAQEVMHMTDYSKITALYSRLSVGDEDRDGGESNSIQNQKIFLENYARGQHLTNIRHYIDDDESGRFFDRSAYSRMMDDVENGKIGVCI